MGISDMIASFIDEMLKDSQSAELQRSELATKFNCVPSQINYVISTRFSPERGYIVESRRGGGGYIRIIRVREEPRAIMMHTLNAVGESIDLRSATALISNAVHSEALSENAGRLMLAAVSDAALRACENEKRDEVRAGVLKQMILRIIQ